MKIIKAVAGILYQNNNVLIASRPESRTYAGCWEFPGGKIEQGESVKQALIRELNEEIGIVVAPQDIKHIIYIKQPYSTHEVCLDVMFVNQWINDPCALEEQELFWQPLNQFCNKSPLLLTTQKILTILKEF